MRFHNADGPYNTVFTLGLRHTFQLCQRGQALVQSSGSSGIVRFVKGGDV